MILVQNAHVSFAGRPVLRGLSFEVPSGSIVGYVGPNGAGKTTTLRLLTGTLAPERGRVMVAGLDVAEEPLAVRRRYGFVPENGHLYESFTPVEYLRFVGRMHGLDDALLDERTNALLAFWKLAPHATSPLGGFSKGMKQKVLLSAALLHDPEVLLLDEPLSGLDAEAVLQVRALLKALAAGGKTVFYSSHILDAVEKIVDGVLVLRDGQIVHQGTTESLKALTQSASLESAFSQLTATDDVEARAHALLNEAF